MAAMRPDPPLLTAGRDLPQHTGARRVVTDATLIRKSELNLELTGAPKARIVSFPAPSK
jgi:hypothetical protein